MGQVEEQGQGQGASGQAPGAAPLGLEALGQGPETTPQEQGQGQAHGQVLEPLHHTHRRGDIQVEQAMHPEEAAQADPEARPEAQVVLQRVVDAHPLPQEQDQARQEPQAPVGRQGGEGPLRHGLKHDAGVAELGQEGMGGAPHHD